MVSDPKTHEVDYKSRVHVFDRPLPEFAKEKTTFNAFLRAYYEWLGENLSNVESLRSVESTPTDFLYLFREEYLSHFPEEILADERLVVLKAKQLYSTKGTTAAVKFLFRVLFDSDVEIYLPKDDILRASDGKWYVKTSVFTTYTDASRLHYLTSTLVTGSVSGATAVVEDIIVHNSPEGQYAEFVLSNIEGDFEYDEYLRGYSEYGDMIQERIYPVITSLTVNNGGSGYAVSDKVQIVLNDSSLTRLGFGHVTKLDASPITDIIVVDPGSGYQGNLKHVTRFIDLPLTYIIDGTPIYETFITAQDSNAVDYASLPLTYAIPAVDVPGVGDIVSITDVPTSYGYGASAVIQSVDSDGAIDEILLTNGGDLYEQPEASVISETGSGAVLQCIGGASSIKTAVLDEFVPVISGDVSDYTTFTTAGSNSATFDLGVSAVATYAGRWINSDGFLSSDKKLQDNYYYQQYSYVLRSGLSLSTYENIIKDIIHPAGLKMFGEIYYTNLLRMPTSLSGVITSVYDPALGNIAIDLDGETIVSEIQSIDADFDLADSSYESELMLIDDIVLGDIDDYVFGDGLDDKRFDDLDVYWPYI